MEALEFTFEKSKQKTPTIGIYQNTFILIKGNIKNQKFKIQSGIYIERKESEFIPSSDFHLYKPKPDERVISVLKHISDEGCILPVKIFFGELHELLLAELYYTYHLHRRSVSNYASRQLVFGDRRSTHLSIELNSNKYILNIEIHFPVSKNTHKIEFPEYTNEFKTIESLFRKIKISPAPNPSSDSELQLFLLKYFPSKPYT